MAIIDLDGINEKLEKNLLSSLWENLALPCVGCGICTYLCPTCHCFDISDETGRGRSGIRLRTWDSCQYPQFTLHTSGHNPRPLRYQRMRQRIMHKFSYTVANTGRIFCVGCGRCIENCPVNLDIRIFLNSFGGL
jgi:ferredoxin